VVRGTRLRRLRLCFAGGVLLGLGFLTKLWLITPYVLGACGFGLVQTTLARQRDDHPLHLRRSVTAIAAGFLLSASAHLALVAVLSPQDLRHWIESVYLGIFSGSGVTGAKLSGTSDASAQPVWYYPAVLYRQHSHLLPLIAFGLPALLRRGHVHAVSALAIAFGASLGVVALSVPEVKEPLYVLAVAPPWYALAGVSLAELESDSPMHQPANRATVEAVLWIMALAVIAAFAWWFAAPDTLSLRAVVMHAAGMLACGALGIAWATRRSVALPLLCACAIALGAFIVDSARDRRADTYRALASALRPLLDGAAPAYPSFAAPHSRLLMGYVDHAGIDWPAQTPGDVLSDVSLRAFLVGPQEQARPGFDQVLTALQNRCVELSLPASEHRLFQSSAADR